LQLAAKDSFVKRCWKLEKNWKRFCWNILYDEISLDYCILFRIIFSLL